MFLPYNQLYVFYPLINFLCDTGLLVDLSVGVPLVCIQLYYVLMETFIMVDICGTVEHVMYIKVTWKIVT